MPHNSCGCLICRMTDTPRNAAEVLLAAVEDTFFNRPGLVIHDASEIYRELTPADYEAAMNRAKIALDFYNARPDLKLRALYEDWSFADIIRELY